MWRKVATSSPLDDLDPDAVRVVPDADAIDGDGPVRQEMKRLPEIVGASGWFVYGARASAARSIERYDARHLFRGSTV